MTYSNDDISALALKDEEDFELLRNLLAEAGFTETGILDRLGAKNLHSIRGDDIPLLLRLTDRNTPLDTFIRLFLMDVPVETEAFERAVRPMSVESLAQAGLVDIHGTSVVAAVRLLPHQNLTFAFDLPRSLQSEWKENYVMGLGSSSLTLANLTIRKHSLLTLDLGTGCGIQALLAARHSDRVLAVDRNPRAVTFAAFNAKLNGLSHVECRAGDLFGPVQGLTFQLVIANPPFVISPENRYFYRDSGMEADQICQKIVREVPGFLSEKGFCQILCNWVERRDEDWRGRLAAWFVDSGCDVWVMRSETRDAATYASSWIRHTEKNDSANYSRQFGEWMAYYEEQGIDSISAGLITMRRSSQGPNWFRADDAPEKMMGPCGDFIARGFELHDFLEQHRDDAALLNACLRLSPDIRLERLSEPEKGGWTDVSIRLRLSKGLVYSGDADPLIANLIARCDGEHQLGDLVNEMSAVLGIDGKHMETAFCDIARHLIEQGFLLPPHLV